MNYQKITFFSCITFIFSAMSTIPLNTMTDIDMDMEMDDVINYHPNLDSLSYEKANEGDIDALSLLYNEYNKEHQAFICNTDELPEDIERGRIFIVRDIALHGNNIVAFLKLFVVPNDEKGSLHLEAFGSSPELLIQGKYEANIGRTFGVSSPITTGSPRSSRIGKTRSLSDLQDADQKYSPHDRQTHIFLDKAFTVHSRVRNEILINYRDQNIDTSLEKMAFQANNSEIIRDIRTRRSSEVVFLFRQENDEEKNNAQIKLFTQIVQTIKSTLGQRPSFSTSEYLSVWYYNYKIIESILSSYILTAFI